METICRDTAIIRPAVGSADFRQAENLLRDYVAWIEANVVGVTVFGAQPAFEHELADLEAAYSSPRAVLLVVEEGPELRGTLAVRLDERGRAEFKRMYVDPTCRGRGHAARLLRAGMAWAADAGATAAWLETLPGLMDPAVALYQAHGFERTPTPTLIDVAGATIMTRRLGGIGRSAA